MHSVAVALVVFAVAGVPVPEREPRLPPRWVEAAAEALRSPRTLSVECDVVCVSAPLMLPPLGAGRVIAGRTEGDKVVLAVVVEAAGRPPAAAQQISELEFGDRVSLRGRGSEQELHVALLVEGAKRLSRAFDRPAEPGSLEDALEGPFPFPATLELTQGRRVQARVLGAEGQSLRIRASLAELKIPFAEVRAVARTGGGTSFRARDGRVDFLASIVRGGPEHAIFSAAAAAAWAQVEAKGHIRGTVLRGLRMGHRFGLLVRSKDSGDVLLLLGEARQGRSRTKEASHAAQLVGAAAALKRGDEVVARVRRSGEDLVVVPEEDSLMVADPRAGLVAPSWRDDPDWRLLTPSRREALEAFLNRLAEGPGPETMLAELLKLDPVGQAIAIRIVAKSLDEGWVSQAAVLRAVVEKLPAERLPAEAAQAALRGLFSPVPSVRITSAEILGLLGCREAPPVLAEAAVLFGTGERGEEFRRAAEKAIERIRLAPPQPTRER